MPGSYLAAPMPAGNQQHSDTAIDELGGTGPFDSPVLVLVLTVTRSLVACCSCFDMLKAGPSAGSMCTAWVFDWLLG